MISMEMRQTKLAQAQNKIFVLVRVKSIPDSVNLSKKSMLMTEVPSWLALIAVGVEAAPERFRVEQTSPDLKKSFNKRSYSAEDVEKFPVKRNLLKCRLHLGGGRGNEWEKGNAKTYLPC